MGDIEASDRERLSEREIERNTERQTEGEIGGERQRGKK